MMTDTSTPRKRKAVKMRRLSVELWLQGQQLHRMQGAEPQRQDACGEARMAPYSPVSSPLPRPSTQHPPTARCPLNISKPTQRLPVPHHEGTPLPQMSPHLTFKPKGEAKETKAGRGWVPQGHTASKQRNPDSNLDLSQVLLWLRRESWGHSASYLGGGRVEKKNPEGQLFH